LFKTKLFSTLTILLLASSAFSQCPTQKTGAIVANPNRPTVSDPADITQYGVAEVEYGFSRTWDQGSVHSNSVDGLFKFAVLCDLELRWTQGVFGSQAAPQQPLVHGMGDSWVGAQYRFHHQTVLTPTLALRYEVKIPSASVSKGLGTGEVDHAFTFMASKDVKSLHFDFNAGYLLSGNGTGNDQNSEIALAFSRAIHGPWGITGELYGDTRKNTVTPGFMSNLWGLTYTVRPRFVLDAGMDFGITNGAPHKSVFAGMTYSLGDFSPALRSIARSFGGSKPTTVATASQQQDKAE
jgi:hypothetical protein